MKKQYKKTMGAILATLSMVGVVHADNNTVQVGESGAETKAIIQQLISQGYLIPLAEENWYQVNQERLEALENSYDHDRAAKVVDMLQSLIGEDVDIRNVDAFQAKMSSQDYPGMGK
ncbi:MAG: hypothetical protein AB7N80_09370 [Bdellovibrionales bacterium]